MSENLENLEAQLRDSRRRLAALADQATQLRARLQADTALMISMEKLAEDARNTTPPPVRPESGYRQDDGFYLSDGWEIALINEEGE